MASIRQLQVANTIKKSLGDVFIKYGRDFYGSAFVTITNVKVTADFQIARIYLSVYNVKDKQATIDRMSEQWYNIRRILGNYIKNKVRKVPELEFYLDDTLDEAVKMDAILDDLQEERAEREDMKINEDDYKDDVI